MNPESLSRWSYGSTLWEAAVLAYMRESEHDIRPELLVLFHGNDPGQFEKVHQHGCAYLLAWAAKHEMPITREVAVYAAADALEKLWRRRAPKSLAERSRELGVRNAYYANLRGVAERMYAQRLCEARFRFHAERAGTIYTDQLLGLLKASETSD